MDKIKIAAKSFNMLPKSGPFKKAKQLLNLIADNLPSSYYEGSVMKNVKIRDFRDKEIKNSAVFDPINLPTHVPLSGEDEHKTIKSDVFFKSNHRRRIKDAWNRSGKDGVYEYFSLVGKKNKEVSILLEQKVIVGIVDAKVKASIQEFM